jgi:hypothetical protein
MWAKHVPKIDVFFLHESRWESGKCADNHSNKEIYEIEIFQHLNACSSQGRKRRAVSPGMRLFIS